MPTHRLKDLQDNRESLRGWRMITKRKWNCCLRIPQERNAKTSKLVLTKKLKQHQIYNGAKKLIRRFIAEEFIMETLEEHPLLV